MFFMLVQWAGTLGFGLHINESRNYLLCRDSNKVSLISCITVIFVKRTDMNTLIGISQTG